MRFPTDKSVKISTTDDFLANKFRQIKLVENWLDHTTELQANNFSILFQMKRCSEKKND